MLGTEPNHRNNYALRRRSNRRNTRALATTADAGALDANRC